MPAADCVFCRIIDRTLDSLIIHEDDRTISFLPDHPQLAGHTLVVPKAHHADVYSIPSDLLAALASTCQLLARHWRDHVGTTGVNILHASGADAQQFVFHFHFHLFPRFPADSISAWPVFPRPTQTREQMHATFRLR